MKTTSILSFVALSALASARPLSRTKLVRREVPQEHSHEQYLTTVRNSLNLDNPDGISDPVFGLLGNQVSTVQDFLVILRAKESQLTRNRLQQGVKDRSPT
jgi:hypothetical protein